MRGAAPTKKKRYRDTYNVPGMRNTACEPGSVFYGWKELTAGSVFGDNDDYLWPERQADQLFAA